MTSSPGVIEPQAAPLDELESEVFDASEFVDEPELSAVEFDEERLALVEDSPVDASLLEFESKIDDEKSLVVFEELSRVLVVDSETVVELELSAEMESVAVSVSLFSSLVLVSALFVLETCDIVAVVVDVVDPSPQPDTKAFKKAMLAKKAKLERVKARKHARIESLSLTDGFGSAPSQRRG